MELKGTYGLIIVRLVFERMHKSWSNKLVMSSDDAMNIIVNNCIQEQENQLPKKQENTAPTNNWLREFSCIWYFFSIHVVLVR